MQLGKKKEATLLCEGLLKKVVQVLFISRLNKNVHLFSISQLKSKVLSRIAKTSSQTFNSKIVTSHVIRTVLPSFEFCIDCSGSGYKKNPSWFLT